jgi:hypothetical protein
MTILEPRNRPSFGRPQSIRGLDPFDTPLEAARPVWANEPLLRGVTCYAEDFAGKGNLVIPMRKAGFTVYAADIVDRGCPDCEIRDFFTTTKAPCAVAFSNPPFSRAMDAIEHSLGIGYEVVIFLLKLQFLSTADRFERMHKPGHLRRVHVFAERIQGMHDAQHLAAGGKEAGQSQDHGWFVFQASYRGPATINPISLANPRARMPWAGG